MKELINKLDLNKIFDRVASYANTELGKIIISQDNPASERTEAEYKINLTFELKSFIEQFEEIDYLYLKDVRDIVHKSRIENYVLTPKEIILIGNLLYNSRIIKSKISKYKKEFPLLSSLVENITENLFLERKIKDIIDDYGEIKDSASNELKRIREEIKALQFNIQKINDRILKDLSKDGMVQDELITLRDGRMVIPVKSEFKRKVKGFIHAESASGQTTYIEPAETLELNNELLSLFFEEKREINRILGLLTKDISKFSEELLKNFDIITTFDCHYAKAKYAIEIRANRIIFSDDHSFDLIECRHPVLIQSIGFNNTVPFDLKVHDKINTIVISGPNAGGKTVLMKAIGTICILARIGYLIPAHPDSKIPFFKKIFIDIGDEQSIDNDISTFGSHILNLKYIYENCDEDSLILLDELGTGTDPVQGVALATSILQEFIRKNSFVIVTTHHSFLKYFASNHPQIMNASMEFNFETLEPTYRFVLGIPGSSYTFEIARRMKLSEKILEGAKKFLKQSDIEVENYIAQIQQKAQSYSKLLDELQKEKKDIQRLKTEYNEKLLKVKSEIKEIKKKALLEAESIIQTANKIVESAVREIKEKNADKEAIKFARKKISEEKRKLDKLLDVSKKETEALTGEIEIGNLVKIKGQDSIGKVLSLDRKKNIAIVQVEQFKVTISLDKLSRIEQFEHLDKNFESVSNFVQPVESKFVPFQLDIRGKRATEAEELILKYIDDAVLYGLYSISIIHGKGDGILKNVTQKVLQSHPFVKSFYYAPVDQGGEGVTIVELKD